MRTIDPNLSFLCLFLKMLLHLHERRKLHPQEFHRVKVLTWDATPAKKMTSRFWMERLCFESNQSNIHWFIRFHTVPLVVCTSYVNPRTLAYPRLVILRWYENDVPPHVVKFSPTKMLTKQTKHTETWKSSFLRNRSPLWWWQQEHNLGVRTVQ